MNLLQACLVPGADHIEIWRLRCPEGAVGTAAVVPINGPLAVMLIAASLEIDNTGGAGSSNAGVSVDVAGGDVCEFVAGNDVTAGITMQCIFGLGLHESTNFEYIKGSIAPVIIIGATQVRTAGANFDPASFVVGGWFRLAVWLRKTSAKK